MAAVLTKNRAGHLVKQLCPRVLSGKVLQVLPAVTKTDLYSTSTNAAQHRNSSPGSIKPFSEIPSPKGLPLFGTMFQMPRDPTKLRGFLMDRCHKFYPIYKENVPGFNMVVLYDLVEIEKLFRNEAKYPRRFDFLYWIHYRKISGEADGVLTSNDEPWHRMRKVIDKPMLRIKDVSGYADDVNEVLTDFLERLREIRQEDGLIPDLERELFNWSLETIGKILYERRFGGLSSDGDREMQEFIEAVRTMLTTSIPLMVYPIWFSKIFLRQTYNKHIGSWDTLFRIARKCVDERMNEIATNKREGKEAAGVLSHLLSDDTLSIEEVYSNITELMTGAVDTTSTAMLWMFQELALNPDVQDKLLAEVESVVPDGKTPSYQDLQKMPYLKAISKETMRKYPVASGIPRVLQEDMEIAGYLVPAKTPVVIYNVIMGHLPQYFDEPEKFKPERWLRGTGDKVNPFSLLPFGFGTRMCVGRRVAELEINMLMSRLIRKYSIEPAFTERAIESMGMVLKPDRPIKIKLRDRK